MSCITAGKSTMADHLSKRYGATLVTVDGIVTDAIVHGNTPAGLRAREMCAEAGRQKAEELRANPPEEAQEKKAATGLSVEAVNAHTQLATGGK